MTEPGPYFAAAPTRDQVRRIYWEDLKLLSFDRALSDSRKAELTIAFPNGSTIVLIGLDEPKRIEGTFWMGGLVDEIADVHEDAWPLNIAPALDTYNPMRPDYRPWCWLYGVPEGLNHFYELAQYAETSGDPDWGFYTWESAGILPPDVIESAQRKMSKHQYDQEYRAQFAGATGRIYADYNRDNVTSEKIEPHEQLCWAHDFNYTPMSSCVVVVRGKRIIIADEIVLTSAVARQSAIEFVNRYRSHKNRSMLLYGDPAGRAGEKHGQSSNYTEIEQVLRANGWLVERRVKEAAPAIRDRQNAVRAKICNAANERFLFINPALAPMAHKGLNTVQLKKGSAFIEEVSDAQHITTAIGYFVEREWPVREPEPESSTYVPSSRHHWNDMRKAG